MRLYNFFVVINAVTAIWNPPTSNFNVLHWEMAGWDNHPGRQGSMDLTILWDVHMHCVLLALFLPFSRVVHRRCPGTVKSSWAVTWCWPSLNRLSPIASQQAEVG
jgi:hypothetical protein